MSRVSAFAGTVSDVRLYECSEGAVDGTIMLDVVVEDVCSE